MQDVCRRCGPVRRRFVRGKGQRCKCRDFPWATEGEKAGATASPAIGPDRAGSADSPGFDLTGAAASELSEFAVNNCCSELDTGRHFASCAQANWGRD